ncbi:MAG: orotate phosphoribosyltransferase [Chitinophagaceae bacterium]
MLENGKKVAEKLLQINAIRLNIQNPFTWASGWKSPIYCDNRKILSFPFVRDFIKSEMSNLVDDQFPEAKIIAGVATAGIPHGVLVADQLKLPFIYVRSKAKEHGLGNRIEGILGQGDKVMVIEDLISTGKSSLEVCEALRSAGAEIVGLVAIFNYGFPIAEQAFAQAGIPFRSLSNYEWLIQLASEKGIIQEEELATLMKWRQSPDQWGK